MCGIAGILKFDNNMSLLNEAQAMMLSMGHRGPDDCGYYGDNDVVLAHTRLSIIDPSKDGHQPMQGDGVWDKIHVVFNGEIYNYIELRNELKDRGHTFRTKTDTEVLIKGYVEWGIDNLLEKLNGIFAFAIWDSRIRRLILARDRLGVKPLYYWNENDRLVFASEPKTIFAAGVKPEPDYNTIGGYLMAGRYGTNHTTFFKGIHQVMPGFYHWYTPETHGQQRYWHLPLRELFTNPESAIENYSEIMRNAVMLNLRSDVGYAMCLSSGLDSSLLFQIAKGFVHDKEAIHTYTHTCGMAEYDESKDVNSWMAKEGFPHFTIRFGEDDFNEENVRKAVRVHDEPFGGLPTMVYERMFKFASDCGDKVLLCGEGMDEQFAGYDYYANGESSTVQGTRDPLATDVVALKYEEIHKQVCPEIYASRIANLRYRDMFYTKIPRSLRFADRISMAHGCELRVPFLDHRLVELCFRLPDSMLIRDGVNKWLLRQIAYGCGVPMDIVTKPKRKMWTPMREWLRWDKTGMVESILLSKKFRERGLYDIPKLYDRWKKFVAGEYDNAFFLWQWIGLELWFQEAIDGRH